MLTELIARYDQHVPPPPGVATSPGQARPLYVPPGEGRGLWVVGDTYTFKATGEQTGGRLAVFEASMPPGPGRRPTPTTTRTRLTTF